jgi:anaerobic ribonucleoside-triphosphate reductase activating protein
MNAPQAHRSRTTHEAAFTVDAVTGGLLLECRANLPARLRKELERLLGPGEPLACAVPTALHTLPAAFPDESASEATVQIAGFWHNSLIEGPGRRSVVKLVGCPIRCRACITPDSWDLAAGCPVSVDRLAIALLDPAHRRDGVSILGGEPFAQPDGLLALVRALRDHGCAHILCYSGYTHERLQRMATALPAIGSVLDEIDMLIDGPFVAALAAGAGPWTGSGNQRVIDLAASRCALRPAVIIAPETLGL